MNQFDITIPDPSDPQLGFDFGPEHPHNEPRVQRSILLGAIRRIIPLQIAKDIVGVQPMSQETNNALLTLFAVKPKTFIPDPADFQLTEPFSKADERCGCWGMHFARQPWERAVDPTQCNNNGCSH